MAAQLQIVVRDMAQSEAIETLIRRRLAGLERICPRITSIHVTLSISNHHQHGPRFCAKLDIRMPRVEVTVTRDHRDDIRSAIGEAWEAARRQLVDHMRKGHGSDSTHRQDRQIERESAGNE